MSRDQGRHRRPRATSGGTALRNLYGRNLPYFRPRFLGEKFSTFDFIVEVADDPALFFFLQVKATTQGYTKEEHRLLVQLDQADVNRMVACPAPAYLIGVDANAIGVGYLLSVNEPRAHVASLTTKFKIDGATLESLRDEVMQYWTSRDTVLRGSRFRE